VTRSDGAWRPLLHGAEARRALEIATAIADDIDARFGSVAAHDPFVTLLFAHLGRALDDRRYADAAQRSWGAVCDGVQDLTSYGLYGGVAGTMWLQAYLARYFPGSGASLDDAAPGDPEEEAGDVSLGDGLAECLRPPGRFPYELIAGVAGMGVAWLEQLPDPRAALHLAELVGSVAATAEETPSGLRWRTNTEARPPLDRPSFPAGNHDVGVSHGVAGLAVVLARIAGAGIDRTRAASMAARAMAWVLARRAAGGHPWSFPSAVEDDDDRRPPIDVLQWCYGGLGIGAALLNAGHHLGEPEWSREGVAILEAASAVRDPGAAGRDAGLCHGTSGAAHIFNRAFQTTGAPDLAAGALHWFRATIASWQPGVGVGGYRAWGEPRPISATVRQQLTWVDLPDWLEGACGSGLALLAAATGDEPSWDRLLALS
jgi:hypothetical protein